jgi:sialate O-acetylesterase
MRLTSSQCGRLAVLSLVLSLSDPLAAWAAPDKLSLSQLFTEHAVLQRAAKVPVWGWDKPGQAVTVTYGEAKGTATADENGRWQVDLNLEKAGADPTDLVVTGSSTVTSADVIVGEVWLASGQSNMEWSMAKTAGLEEEKALSPTPAIRYWKQAYVTATEPKDQALGKWVVAKPDNIGGISGVGYFFAKDVAAGTGATVGLVHSHWGGTPAEAWTSREGLAKDPEVGPATDEFFKRMADFPRLLEKFATDYPAWQEKNGRADKPLDEAAQAEFLTGPTDGEGWKKIKYTGKLADSDLKGAGAIWFRKTITLDAEGKKGQTMRFGPIPGLEQLYVNGKKVGERTIDKGFSGIREYKIGGDLLVEGENQIAIRAFIPGRMTEFGKDGNSGRPAWVQGEWQAKSEFVLDPLADDVLATAPTSPQSLGEAHNRPAHLYNAMLNPLIPFSIRGVIWYQGESNSGRAEQYRRVFPNMIEDWRGKWGGEPFAFYFCQLANYQAKAPSPWNSGWAETREAQEAALKLPNTGEAILIDCGEEGDIHPRNKKDPGQRLARVALAKTYGKDIIYSGPTLKDSKFAEGKAVLTFDHVGTGLVAQPLPATYKKKSLDTVDVPLTLPVPDSEVQGFAVCGEDKQWAWATAKITGKNTVELTSATVANPVAVRYAWANNPTCNLYNSEGLPTGPFRTDASPLTSIGKWKP